MAVYRLSSKAAADLDAVYEYTILNFGLEQARAYLSGLHERFETLAEHPMHGRKAGELAPGLRRFEYQSPSSFTCPRTRAFRSCAFCTKTWTSKGTSSPSFLYAYL